MSRFPAALSLLFLLSCGAPQGGSGDEGGELPVECARLLGDDDEVQFTATQATPVLIENARILTATGEIFEHGHIYFEDGVIRSVGEGLPDPLPEGLYRIDAEGRHVTPGLIDTHSHLGVFPSPGDRAHADGNEATSPNTAEVDALHSIWPQDAGFQRAAAGGVTTLQILPGSANLFGGLGVTLRSLPNALAASDLVFPGAPRGLKMACGENPKRVYGGRSRAPSTRMGNVALTRQALANARRYERELTSHEEQLRTWCEDGARGDRPTGPAPNLQNEHLARALRGEILFHIHCYRADEMRILLDLAEEFDFSIRSFHHAVEAYKIRQHLADREVSASVWADWWGFKLEAFDAILENAALLHDAGARAIIHSDSAIGIQVLNQEAAKAWYAGQRAGLDISEDDALRWITANPAWALGIEDQVGTLEPGRRADIVLWSGHPFSIYTRADYTFVDGILVHASDEAAAPWSDFELGLWPEEAAP